MGTLDRTSDYYYLVVSSAYVVVTSDYMFVPRDYLVLTSAYLVVPHDYVVMTLLVPGRPWSSFVLLLVDPR